MKENRPVNLDLATIRLPINAITSITHRISGIAIFFGLAIFLYMFDKSVTSEAGFLAVKECLENSFLTRAVVWLVLSGFIYHIVMGVKHLIMDLGFGETLESGPKAAKAALVVAFVLILVAGVWLW